MCLFGGKNETETIKAISDLDVPCFFRVGERGSYMILAGQSYFAPSVTVGPIVDVTGCGNASTAAALYGYCEGMSGERIAALANISAAYNLLQYGPFPSADRRVRTHALGLLDGVGDAV
jgi:sugar/nucleoside kinase (ribokinase family)